MRVSTLAIRMLVGVPIGTALGMAVHKHSARDIQSTYLYQCSYQTSAEFSAHYWAFLEDRITSNTDERLCNPGAARREGDANLEYDNFEFMSYGVTCQFFVDSGYSNTDVGLPFGHASCPNESMRDIKGVKGSEAFIALCEVTEDGQLKMATCEERMILTWDGSLA